MAISCSCCKKKYGLLRKEHFCSGCAKSICSHCAKTVNIGNREVQIMFEISHFHTRDTFWGTQYLCPSCAEKYQRAMERYAQINPDSVRVYSANYRGRIPEYQQTRRFESDYYTDKNEALEEFKRVAACEGYKYIINLTYGKKTCEDGNYKYSVWRAIGDMVR